MPTKILVSVLPILINMQVITACGTKQHHKRYTKCAEPFYVETMYIDSGGIQKTFCRNLQDGNLWCNVAI